MTRLYEKYKNELVSQLQSKLKIRNIMEVPKLTKITINMGVGDAVNDKKINYQLDFLTPGISPRIANSRNLFRERPNLR